jgi:hypothetical protein
VAEVYRFERFQTYSATGYSPSLPGRAKTELFRRVSRGDLAALAQGGRVPKDVVSWQVKRHLKPLLSSLTSQSLLIDALGDPLSPLPSTTQTILKLQFGDGFTVEYGLEDDIVWSTSYGTPEGAP